MSGIKIKGMSTAATLLDKSHITMLSSKEAETLPPLFPSQSKAASAAAAGVTIKQDEDGLYTWTDADGLVWNFSMETEEELCLGRKAPSEDDTEDDTSTDPGEALEALEASLEAIRAAAADQELDEATTEALEALEADVARASELLDDEDESGFQELITSATAAAANLMEKLSDSSEEDDDDTGDEDVVDDDDTKEPEEDELSKKAVIKAAKAAKLPTAVVEVVEKASGIGLDELLGAAGAHIADLQKQVDTMQPMASAGEAHLKELRAEAIHWYVMSNKGSGEKGVNTSRVERLLDMADGDIELMKELRDQYKDNARARFPEAVRRSSFPDNINERSALGEDTPNTVSTEGVKRIHG